MKTLLDKAKEIGVKKGIHTAITEEEHELAVAWAKGELSLGQIQKVLEYRSANSVYIFLSNCFKYSILKNNKLA